MVPPYSNYFFVHIEKDSLQNIKFDPTEYSFTFKDVKTDYDPELKFIHIKNMPQYHWYMIWKKESKTKIQEKFIDYLKQYYE